MLEISKKLAFNNGLLTGIVIRSPSLKNEQATQAAQPASATTAA